MAGGGGMEDSLRVLFCEQTIFAAIFPDIAALRHGRGWCKTVFQLFIFLWHLSFISAVLTFSCSICTELIVHGQKQNADARIAWPTLSNGCIFVSVMLSAG